MSRHVSTYVSLDYLHVGKDKFERTVSINLALYLKLFLHVKPNQCINHLKYLGHDANNKPPEVDPGAGKLSDQPLKSKHCYVNHYPELIVPFGPLIIDINSSLLKGTCPRLKLRE